MLFRCEKTRLLELLLHCRVSPCKLLDGQVFCLVVGEPEVVLRADERLLDFLEVVDGLVNLIDGFFELLAGKV